MKLIPEWAPRWTRMARNMLYVALIGGAVLLVFVGDYSLAIYFAAVAMMNFFADRRAFYRYRQGWFEGRWAAITSLQEAGRRGFTFEQWLASLGEVDEALSNDKKWPSDV